MVRSFFYLKLKKSNFLKHKSEFFCFLVVIYISNSVSYMLPKYLLCRRDHHLCKRRRSREFYYKQMRVDLLRMTSASSPVKELIKSVPYSMTFSSLHFFHDFLHLDFSSAPLFNRVFSVLILVLSVLQA